MKKLTIEQFCRLETLKTDLLNSISPEYKCQEKIKDNLTVLEITDAQGNVIRELILIL